MKYDKLKWNIEINKLADFFYRRMNEKNAKGKPILESTKENLIKFLCDNFLDFKGDPFKIETIRSYLKPHSDKRPSSDKEVD